MDLINEAEIRDTWSPIIESATGITESAKLGWMATLCHNHKLYEDANIMSLNPTMNLMGMGAASAPTGNLGNVDGSGTKGSGDKVPSLLPLAMQVAGQTIALDLVPVVPMAGPMGLLSYLDFTYQGGTTTNKVAPTYIKCTLAFEEDADKTTYLGGANSTRDLLASTELLADYTATNTATATGATILTASVAGAFSNWPATGYVRDANSAQFLYNSIDAEGTVMTLNAPLSEAQALAIATDVLTFSFDDTYADATDAISAAYTYIGTSRIDGKHIFEVVGDIVQTTIATDLHFAVEANDLLLSATAVGLVNGLEDHIAGFSAADNDGNPYSREAGESTPDKLMGLTLYSKTVTAETFQAAAAVTREQVQDLQQFGVDAVKQVEGVLLNEVTQSINNLILKKLRAHGDANAYLTASTSVLDLDLTTVFGGQTPGSQHRRILTQILAAANYIANKGRRGAGNFCVVSARVASVIQSVSGFVPNPIANTVKQVAGGIYPLGSVAGVNIYTDPAINWGTTGNEDILVGRKGDGNGAGVVFMPYLMAESVQVIAEGTMAPKVAIKSRFALVDAGHHPETSYANFHITGFAI